MPSVIYKCDICSETFSTQAEAQECESRGLASIPEEGVIFRNYTSNTNSELLAMVKATRQGHGLSMLFIGKSDDAFVRLITRSDTPNAHPVRTSDVAVWSIFAELVRRGVRPKFLMDFEDTGLNEVIDLDDLAPREDSKNE